MWPVSSPKTRSKVRSQTWRPRVCTGKTVHHVCDSAPFESLRNYVPAVHQKFCGIFRSDSLAYHLVKADDRSGLKHSAQNCLFAHKVRFNFRNERRFKNTCLASAHSYSQGLCISPAFLFRVVYRVNGDKVRNTESSLEFVPYFCSRSFWSAHYNCDVRTDLQYQFLLHWD